MATAKGLLTKQQESAPAKAPSALSIAVSQKSVHDRFEKMLGKRTDAFLSSLLTIANNDKALQKCLPQTILSAASIAASFDFSINPALGFAWIIPYGNKAQFQLGYKGLIQLAQRSGYVTSIISEVVYEGEILNWNRFTERFEYGEKLSDTVVGYFASFELQNGFKKSVYCSKEDVTKHAKRFSKTFGNGPWQTDFDAMAKKTVLASLLRNFAPMSIEMQRAFENDGVSSVFNEQGGQDVIDIDFNASGSSSEPQGEEITVEPVESVTQEDFVAPMD